MKILTTDEAQEAERQTWTEARFTKEVIALAKSCGWRTAHFRPAQTKSGHWITAVQGDGKGFFDLVLVRCRKIIFAELKVKGNKLTTEQKEWRDVIIHVALDNPKVSYALWTPDCWEHINSILR